MFALFISVGHIFIFPPFVVAKDNYALFSVVQFSNLQEYLSPLILFSSNLYSDAPLIKRDTNSPLRIQAGVVEMEWKARI